MKVAAGEPDSATWSNWSGLETATPSAIYWPVDVHAVAEVIQRAAERGLRVKPVGAGHSFSGIAVPDDIQLRLDRMTGIAAVDGTRVTVHGGTRLADLNVLLAERGLAMANLGDIDTQTITGAIATGTHGTGATVPGLAAQVRALTMVRADGRIVHCSPEHDADLFHSARVGLGALGVVTDVTLECVPAFLLRAVEAPQPLEAVLGRLDDLVDGNDHFEFYWFPHTARTLTKRNNRVPEGSTRAPLPRWRAGLDDEFLSNTVFEWTNRLAARRPAWVPAINGLASRALTARSYTDHSHRVFASPRRVVFRESEYAVPRAAVPDVLAALRTWIDRHDERLPFPVEVRFAAPDDVWLSTGYERANGYVAVHQYHRLDHRRYFAAFESIVAEHEGRPHWGKLHTLELDRLRELYPRLDDVRAVRDRVDPERRFGGAYLDRVLGP